MQQREVFPAELVELFNDLFEDYWPLGPTYGLADTEYDTFWSFAVSEGVGILQVSLRDCYGNAEDFEWELNLKSR